MLDTQLVSYAMKGNSKLPDKLIINSVVAQELLLMQSATTTKNRYYIPHLPSSADDEYTRLASGQLVPHGPQCGKRNTDQFVLDFGNDYPRVVEYSHLSLSEALNRRRYQLIVSHAGALHRRDQRVIRRRLRFLLEHEVLCIPLVPQSAETALALFSQFTHRFALKSSFRNSLNDILGVAVAHDSGYEYVTEDSVLSRFIDTCRPAQGGDIDKRIGVRNDRESKEYVNRPRHWRIRA